MPASRSRRDASAPKAPSPPAAPGVPSPCTGVCRIDPCSGRCVGCLRSLDEIAAWPTLADADRLALRRELRARRAAAACGSAQGAPPGAAAEAP